MAIPVAQWKELRWTLGYVIVGPLAYALPDWRLLTLATSIPLVLTLSYIW